MICIIIILCGFVVGYLWADITIFESDMNNLCDNIEVCISLEKGFRWEG